MTQPTKIDSNGQGSGLRCQAQSSDARRSTAQAAATDRPQRAWWVLKPTTTPESICLAEGLAIVQTVDFFTPIVDDPHLFGADRRRECVERCLCDGWPAGVVAIDRGLSGTRRSRDSGANSVGAVSSKMNEANCSVIGGHSIRNEDMLFGYAVTGVIDPRRIWRNVGAQPGDVLLFTKPLGTGVITTALKKDRATPEALPAATTAMTTLNRAAAKHCTKWKKNSVTRRPIHAVTDVTGFSLLGHAREMALGDPSHGAAPVSLEIDHAAFDYFPGAIDAAREGHLSGGLKNNRAFIGDCAAFSPSVSPELSGLALRSANFRRIAGSRRTRSSGCALAALKQPWSSCASRRPRRRQTLTADFRALEFRRSAASCKLFRHGHHHSRNRRRADRQSGVRRRRNVRVAADESRANRDLVADARRDFSGL